MLGKCSTTALKYTPSYNRLHTQCRLLTRSSDGYKHNTVKCSMVKTSPSAFLHLQDQKGFQLASAIGTDRARRASYKTTLNGFLIHCTWLTVFCLSLETGGSLGFIWKPRTAPVSRPR